MTRRAAERVERWKQKKRGKREEESQEEDGKWNGLQYLSQGRRQQEAVIVPGSRGERLTVEGRKYLQQTGLELEFEQQ